MIIYFGLFKSAVAAIFLMQSCSYIFDTKWNWVYQYLIICMAELDYIDVTVNENKDGLVALVFFK